VVPGGHKRPAGFVRLAACAPGPQRDAASAGVAAGASIRPLTPPLLFIWVGADNPWCGRGMKGLPGGTVTFLFSDIEGSTRLVKALRERYPQVLAEHRRLVRAAIAGQGGHEVDTQGDAFSLRSLARSRLCCARWRSSGPGGL
jgi:class 3 adenylate cyclase